MILAKRTPERASREKDGPRAVTAGDRGFLAEMRPHMGNTELIGFAAKADPCIRAISNPVHPASARAENAVSVRFDQIHPDHRL